jgi:hypothetical protein
VAAVAAVRDAQLDLIVDGVLAVGKGRRARTVVGGRHVGHLRPLAGDLQRPTPQRRVDRENLLITDQPDGACLGGVTARYRDDDVEVEHRRRPRIGEILRRRPDQRPAGGGLERRDGRGKSAAAEQKPLAHAELALDGQVPAVRVVGGPEAEELLRVHGLGPISSV